MNESLSPSRLAEFVRRSLPGSHPVAAFWYCVAGDRYDYAAELRPLLADDPVVVLMVREVRFENPNALMDDFVTLLAQHRADCEQSIPPGVEGSCGVVLLARTELQLPNVSSPVQLPEWFPLKGGTVVTTRISDVTWVADAALNAAEASIPEICERLFRLECALVARLSSVHRERHNACAALLETIRNSDAEGFAEILSASEEFIASVTSPSGYRPSLRDARSVVARLWRSAQTSNPDALGRVAKAVARALELRSDFDLPPETLATVLRRPADRDPRFDRRFAFNLLSTIAAAAQLITAAAHADDYPMYPVALIRSTSYDLRRSMLEMEAVLADRG